MIGEAGLTDVITFCVLGWIALLAGVLIGIKILWRQM